MSPTEFDLRRALRDGEGDGVDPEHIVHLGRTRRAQRRTRVLSTAAAVVLVGALGTGAAFLARSGNSDSGAGGSNAAANRGVASTSAAGSSASSAGSAAGGGRSLVAPAAGAPACPSSYPTQVLPGGGSPGQFGSDGPMFAKPPVALLVCAYGADGSTGAPATMLLAGTNARALAESLDNAPTTRTVYPCPQALHPQQNRLAIIGTAADGTVLRTITTEVRNPQCNVMATNGTALRYQWHPPSSLAPTLLSLTSRQSHAEPPSSGNPISKTPVR